MEALTVLVDTREKIPYFYKNHVTRRVALNVGDYTTPLLHNFFHIERKSGQDLYGTMVKGSVRFRKELIRAAERNIKLVVLVEIPKEDFINHNFPHGKAKLRFEPASLRKKLITLGTKYGLEFVWCKHREHAKKRLVSMLKRAESARSSALAERK